MKLPAEESGIVFSATYDSFCRSRAAATMSPWATLFPAGEEQTPASGESWQSTYLPKNRDFRSKFDMSSSENDTKIIRSAESLADGRKQRFL